MDEQRITVTEAIRRYGTSRRTLWRLHQRGELRLAKEVGVKDTLVLPSDLERVLAVPPRMGRPRKLNATAKPDA